MHGEADLVHRLATDRGGRTVLDAGCGMGRVAIELARRGHVVVGVDNDADLLHRARVRTEGTDLLVRWELADLASMTLPERFDLVVMAGNVLVFAVPDRRRSVVINLVRHLAVGGALVTGSTVERAGPGGVDDPDRFDLDRYDRWCDEAGLSLAETYATWDGLPYQGGDYRVSVHLRR